MQRANAVKALRKDYSRAQREGRASLEGGPEAPLISGGGSSTAASERSSGMAPLT
jgi:hypothetical protein